MFNVLGSISEVESGAGENVTFGFDPDARESKVTK